MAISFVGSSTGQSANGNSASITLPGSMQQDDFVIVVMGNSTLSDLALGAAMQSVGWTRLCDLYADDVRDCNMAAWCKFMPATPDTTAVVWGDLTTTNSTGVCAMAFRGVDRTRPLDSLGTTATGINTGNADPPSLTTSGDPGLWVVALCATGHTGGIIAGNPVYNAYPTGYNTNPVSNTGNDTNSAGSGIAYNSSPSNPENPGAFTFTNAGGGDSVDNAWCAMTIALRPAQTSGIRYVGEAGATAVNGGSPSITLPTCLEGDLVIVAAQLPNAGLDLDVAMTTAGYTEVADLFSNDTEDTNLGVFYKFMGPTPDTTAVVTGDGVGTSGNAAYAMVFRGVDPASPMNVAAVPATGFNSGNPAPSSIDPTTTGAMIVVATGSGFAIVSTNAGYVYPQGFFGGTAAELGDTDDSMASVVYGALATVGDPAVPGTLYQSAPSDGTAIPADSTSSSWAAVTMALQPLATLDVSIANHAVGAVRV